MTWRINVESKPVEAYLTALNSRLSRMEPAYREIGGAIVASIQLRFRSGVSPDGVNWEPLKHRSGQPLRDTGALMGSITDNPSNTDVEIGPSGPAGVYAGTHNFGVPAGAYGVTRYGVGIPWGPIPQREFMGFSVEDEVEVVDILTRHLFKASS